MFSWEEEVLHELFLFFFRFKRIDFSRSFLSLILVFLLKIEKLPLDSISLLCLVFVRYLGLGLIHSSSSSSSSKELGEDSVHVSCLVLYRRRWKGHLRISSCNFHVLMMEHLCIILTGSEPNEAWLFEVYLFVYLFVQNIMLNIVSVSHGNVIELCTSFLIQFLLVAQKMIG